MIRFKSGDKNGVPSGYEEYPSSEVTIPSCGLDDVDRSMFTMFDKELNFFIPATDTTPMKKVPVIFASGEKWAQVKGSRINRDKTGTIILPLITIVRTSVEQSPTDDITGRGINQQTGTITVKRRISPMDRDYQNLVNKLAIVNQDNIAVSVGSGALTETTRQIGSLADDPDIVYGGLLKPDLRSNFWEIITIPSPQFYTAKYEVTFWTQYTTHMNILIEKFMSSLLTPGNCLRLETDKGYWFLAFLDGGSFTPDNSNAAGEERIMKTKYQLKVQSYFFATVSPGSPTPVRRMLSSPSISFSVQNIGIDTTSGIVGPDQLLLGSDDPTLPLSIDPRDVSTDQRLRGSYIMPGGPITDPLLVKEKDGRPPDRSSTYVRRMIPDRRTGQLVERLVKVITSSVQGEEVIHDVTDSMGITVTTKTHI